jgi:small neutral amino acid transporter SnatA (MarC family)
MREFLIQTFLTLFVVMDPIALVPAFLGMAQYQEFKVVTPKNSRAKLQA